jgi:hypothetical protein
MGAREMEQFWRYMFRRLCAAAVANRAENHVNGIALLDPGERAAFGERRAGQLTAFRAEAEGVLAGPRALLPDDVFAGPR